MASMASKLSSKKDSWNCARSSPILNHPPAGRDFHSSRALAPRDQTKYSRPATERLVTAPADRARTQPAIAALQCWDAGYHCDLRRQVPNRSDGERAPDAGLG